MPVTREGIIFSMNPKTLEVTLRLNFTIKFSGKALKQKQTFGEIKQLQSIIDILLP